jgi:hypothetical protein
VVPADEWSYVAITVSPTKVTLFLNDAQASFDLTLLPFDLSSIHIGSYLGWGGRNFNGLIDETSFWNKTLTDQEVKLARHLTKSDVSDANLMAYYQFNNNISGTVYDKKSTNDLSINGGATLINSDAPVGPGTSKIMTINAAGTVDFTTAASKMTFNNTGTTPNGEVVVSKINVVPNALPTTNVIDNSYYIIDNYGTNKTFTGLTDITFSNITNIAATSAANVQLFKRNSNADSNVNWGNSIATATSINTTDTSVLFSNAGTLNSFSQFFIGSNVALDVSDHLNEAFKIYPNPITVGEELFFHNLSSKAKFNMFDINGKQIIKTIVNKQTKFILPNLKSGVYFYNVEHDNKIQNGKIIVKN